MKLRSVEQTRSARAKILPSAHVLESLLERFPAARRHPHLVQLWQPYADIVRSFRIG